MNTETENKSIWDLYKENFLIDLWDFASILDDDDENKKEEEGYSVDPSLLKGL
tara:strand:+ start:1685 stop:1843 length:159 start_codon:yes stop_codon:yes gene_type:complete